MSEQETIHDIDLEVSEDGKTVMIRIKSKVVLNGEILTDLLDHVITSNFITSELETLNTLPL